MLSSEHAGATETIEAAPAKINLALHVTGQRADGYHLLESLVTFTEVGDVIRIRDAAEDSFRICGPFSELLQQGNESGNLVLKARDLLRTALPQYAGPVAIQLEKNLPVASGIGGGSADAAATLRALRRHWDLKPDDGTLQRIALSLGADVPMCLASRPLIASGIGETITFLADMPVMALVLVNPLKGVSTPDVFRRLVSKQNPSLKPRGHSSWIDFIAQNRNDLEPPARAILAEITEVSDLLTGTGAQLVRMSGSGATCFGIYPAMDDATAAAAQLRHPHPGWYVQATKTIGGI